MGTAAENFCLRWNDFESNVSGAFRDLRAEADFFDVTLAADNSHGRTLQAHKVILSACSPFFKQMLRAQVNAQHPNPLIYLRGIKISDLESVLDFMYHGEVNVAQDELNSFLAVAEDLQVKGLTQANKEGSAASTSGKRLASAARKAAAQAAAAVSAAGGPAAKRRRDDDIQEVKNEVDASGASTSAVSGTGGTDDYDDETEGTGYGAEGFDEDGNYSYAAGDGDESGMMDPNMTGTGMEGQDSTKGLSVTLKKGKRQVPEDDVIRLEWSNEGQCGKCGKVFYSYSKAKRHFNSVHGPKTKSWECEICNGKYKTADILTQHYRMKHGVYKKKAKELKKERAQQEMEASEMAVVEGGDDESQEAQLAAITAEEEVVHETQQVSVEVPKE